MKNSKCLTFFYRKKGTEHQEHIVEELVFISFYIPSLDKRYYDEPWLCCQYQQHFVVLLPHVWLIPKDSHC